MLPVPIARPILFHTQASSQKLGFFAPFFEVLVKRSCFFFTGVVNLSLPEARARPGYIWQYGGKRKWVVPR